MKKTIQIAFRDGHKKLEFDIPPKCIHCGQNMSPVILQGSSNEKIYEDFAKAGLFLQCTHEDCLKYYALEYEIAYSKTKKIAYSYRSPIEIDLPENIEEVSKTFVEIYGQATMAESEGLDQIAGVGYRKSLEFLIKDYAIRNHPDQADNIKKKMLGSVISEYLGDFQKLQNLAKAATWIGNDETHYERRHTDKDIRDMKAFIKSASQFIAADYDADIAEEFINS